ncbi:MAG: MBL fold metallo-hydrolase [Eubacteriales bacterium]|nr:MBL fold metallo-hydrolase [Eubacteriales bacterium]
MPHQWNQIKGNTGYILSGQALLVTYRLDEKNIVMVDSGTDPDPELIPFLRAQGVSVCAVLHTHLHVDHLANSRALGEAFGARLFANPAEIESVATTENLVAHLGNLLPDVLEMIYHAADFPVEAIPEDSDEITLAGTTFGIRRLYGHSIGHLGFVTPDGVFCVGDAVLSPWLAAHSRMPYCEYMEEQLETLKNLLEEEPFPYYALAHMEVIEGRDIRGLLKQNIRLYHRIFDEIMELLNGPEEYEDFVDSVMYGLDLFPSNPVYREPIRFAARCKIDYLIRTGRIRASALTDLTLVNPGTPPK